MKSDNTILIISNLTESQPYQQILTEAGYHFQVQASFHDASRQLRENTAQYAVILIDTSIDHSKICTFAKAINQDDNLRGLPIIFETEHQSFETIQSTVNAGAHYFLTKPYKKSSLLLLIQGAINNWVGAKLMHDEIRKGLHSLHLMSYGRFFYQTIEECRELAAFLAKVCPKPEKAVIGLSEIMVNAVEHGNLQITYEEKTALLASSAWIDEIAYRLKLAENCHKRVELIFERSDSVLSFQIKDEGQGFHWQQYQDIDPLRLEDMHGRGIAMARLLSFDKLIYQGCGNQVTCLIFL